jgi:hypothetical protein
MTRNTENNNKRETKRRHKMLEKERAAQIAAKTTVCMYDLLGCVDGGDSNTASAQVRLAWVRYDTLVSQSNGLSKAKKRKERKEGVRRRKGCFVLQLPFVSVPSLF